MEASNIYVGDQISVMEIDDEMVDLKIIKLLELEGAQFFSSAVSLNLSSFTWSLAIRDYNITHGWEKLT